MLAPLLQNDDEKVADAAAAAISSAFKNSHENGARYFVPMLQHRIASVRGHALKGLPDAAWDEAYRSLLLRILEDDPEDGNRASAAVVIGSFHIASARKNLEAARVKGPDFVRFYIDAALKDLDNGGPQR